MARDKMIRDKMKDLLRKIALYKLGRYPEKALDKEITEFLLKAEDYVCSALEGEGMICFRDYKVDYGSRGAKEMCQNDYENVMLLSQDYPDYRFIADLILTSTEFERVKRMPLHEKILFFDKLINLEHYGHELYEKDVFGVGDIAELKDEVGKEIARELYRIYLEKKKR